MAAPLIYDVAGIGIGPFNLGLAALAYPIHSLSCIFFDQHPKFNWHPGLLMDFTTLQVPFYADLVTLADPTNPFSFLSYLKTKGRLLQFAIKENNYIPRVEYNNYCQWVATQLPALFFNHKVTEVTFISSLQCYAIRVHNLHGCKEDIVYARHLVMGTGPVPYLPEFVPPITNTSCHFHAGRYLYHKKRLLERDGVTIIGSGQSAAEIFYDLLQHLELFPQGIQWFTRADRFHQMETSKLVFEMTSPEYIRYFYHLPAHKKANILQKQQTLYKGISHQLLSAIYDLLYQKTIQHPDINTGLFTNCELKNMTTGATGYELAFYQHEQLQYFKYNTPACILATGYTYQSPSWILPIRERIRWNKHEQYDVQENYSISIPDNEIFVQNGELHTHGFSAPDLGMGPQRNAIILNTILGYSCYKIEQYHLFQTFGVPANAKNTLFSQNAVSNNSTRY